MGMFDDDIAMEQDSQKSKMRFYPQRHPEIGDKIEIISANMFSSYEVSNEMEIVDIDSRYVVAVGKGTYKRRIIVYNGHYRIFEDRNIEPDFVRFAKTMDKVSALSKHGWRFKFCQEDYKIECIYPDGGMVLLETIDELDKFLGATR